MASHLLIQAILLAVLLSASCSQRSSVPDSDTLIQQAEADLTSEARSKADSALATMSLKRKIGLTLMPAMYASADWASLEHLRSYIERDSIGGIVLLKGTAADASVLADSMRSLSTDPPFIAVDAEWGLAMRFSDCPEFPRFGNICKEADENLMYEYGAELARECRVAGINILLGPVMDIVSGQSRAIGNRSLGADVNRVSDLATAYARGVESAGVISVAKHFPGHGDAADSHMTLPVIGKSAEQMLKTDIVPFRRYVDMGLSAIMVGHLAVPSLGGNIPAAVNVRIITQLLRERMGFRGLVLTDALNMAGASGHTAAEALCAGADIVLAPADTRRAAAEIEEALKQGVLTGTILDERCRRILFYKYLMAARESPTANTYVVARINTQHARELARRLYNRE